MISETGKQIRKQYKITSSQVFFTYIKTTFVLLFLHWMPGKHIAGIKTINCSLAVSPPSQTVSSWFDTKLFQYNSKSIRYPPKVDSTQTEVIIR